MEIIMLPIHTDSFDQLLNLASDTDELLHLLRFALALFKWMRRAKRLERDSKTVTHGTANRDSAK